MKRNLYDVYDLSGNKIIEESSGTEIAKALGTTVHNVTRSALEDRCMLNRYKVVRVGSEENDKESIVKRMLLEEWDKIIKPFKKVVWVKESGPGVKELSVRGKQ